MLRHFQVIVFCNGALRKLINTNQPIVQIWTLGTRPDCKSLVTAPGTSISQDSQEENS